MRAPSPGWLAAVSVPPCARASSAATARPIPLPEVLAAARLTRLGYYREVYAAKPEWQGC